MMAVDLQCERQIIKLFQATFPAETQGLYFVFGPVDQ